MHSFYFVRRSSLAALEAKKIKMNRKMQEKGVLERISGADADEDAPDKSYGAEDEANAVLDDGIMKPVSFENKLSENQEMKTKTLVELTSRNTANKITEEDSDEVVNTQGSGEDDDPTSDVYNDLRAIGIA